MRSWRAARSLDHATCFHLPVSVGVGAKTSTRETGASSRGAGRLAAELPAKRRGRTRAGAGNRVGGEGGSDSVGSGSRWRTVLFGPAGTPARLKLPGNGFAAA